MSAKRDSLTVTYTRNLPGEADEMADALLFVSPKMISDETMEEALTSPSVAKFFASDKPLFALRYHKPEDATLKFKEEWRLVVTNFRYYNMPMNDAQGHVSVAYKTADGQTKLIKYQETLDNCVELYRLRGCQDCPKKGLACVEQNMGERPWFYAFSYNRKYDEWCKDMCDDGNIINRKEENEKHLLPFKTLTEVEKLLTSAPPLEATFVHPDNTQTGQYGVMKHPLRPLRDHRFFPMTAKKAAKTKTEAAV